MAITTPKIDSIITEFGRRIAKQVTITDGALADYDSIMTAQVYISYINRAMLKLFNDKWIEVGYDEVKFSEAFPELVKFPSASIVVDIASTVLDTKILSWTKASPYQDMFLINDVINTSDSLRVSMQDAIFYGKIVDQAFPHLTPSATYQLGIFGEGKLSIFYTGTAKTSVNCRIYYIALPIDPSTGGLLTQNGTYDSPFTEQWNGRIAEIAEKLYINDAQLNS